MLLALASLFAPKQGMMAAQELEKQRTYQAEMTSLLNLTDTCLRKEGFTEHFEDEELADQTIEQMRENGNVTTENRNKGILDSYTIYCPTGELK